MGAGKSCFVPWVRDADSLILFLSLSYFVACRTRVVTVSPSYPSIWSLRFRLVFQIFLLFECNIEFYFFLAKGLSSCSYCCTWVRQCGICQEMG
jgi:hypothetical protein